MKNFITFVNIGVVFFLGWILSEKNDGTDTKQLADNTTIERAEAKMPVLTAAFANAASKSEESANVRSKIRNEEVTTFVMELSEARIMDMEEGKLAEQRATSRTLKDYGTLMVSDQSNMLRDLKAIARDKHIAVSNSLGEDKAEGLAGLKKVQGKDFDARFVKMMIIDHKRDIRKLEKATESPDADIKVFATHYLPVIKSHLEKIEAIRKQE